MHILLTVNAAWNLVNFRAPLIRAFIKDGHRVSALAPPDGAVEQLEDMGVEFYPLEMDKQGLSMLGNLAVLQKLNREFRDLSPDLVLSWTIKNNLFGAMAAKWQGIPFVPNVSGLGTAFLGSGILMQVAKLLYRGAFANLPVVFFQNDEDQTLFLDNALIKSDQPRLLPGSGIDPVAYPATDQPKNPNLVFLLVSRLLRDKGIQEFVDAASRVKRTHPNVRFQLLGAAGSENRTSIGQDKVDEWVANGLVEHLGTTDDVRPYLVAADCVVLPSYREGMPRTLLEAASMARPLIATDVPGCRHVVREGENGFLCEVKSGEALAEAMIKMIELHPAERNKLGLAARYMIETEFDEKFVVQAYRQAIKDVT